MRGLVLYQGGVGDVCVDMCLVMDGKLQWVQWERKGGEKIDRTWVFFWKRMPGRESGCVQEDCTRR